MNTSFEKLVGQLKLVFFGSFLAFNALNPSFSLAGEREDFVASVVNELEVSIENSRISFIDLVQAKFENLGESSKVSRDAYLQTYLDAFDLEVANLDRFILNKVEQFTQVEDSEITFEYLKNLGRFVSTILNPERILQSLEGKVQIPVLEVADATSEIDPELCKVCKKKTHLMFICKCEGNFCTKHRDSLKHKCTYDYRKAQQELLRKRNPKIVASKITSI
ncbi:MAG: AN1-type zinc finger protein [Bdellovibrionia bacterium]